jgi:hypothetical protein
MVARGPVAQQRRRVGGEVMSKRGRPFGFDCFAHVATNNSGHPMAPLKPMAGRMTGGASIVTGEKGAGKTVLQ